MASMIALWPALKCRRRMVLLQVFPFVRVWFADVGANALKLANLPAQRAAWRALRCRGSAERDVSLCAATMKVFWRAAAQRCTTPGPTTGWRSSSTASAWRKALRCRGMDGRGGGLDGVVLVVTEAERHRRGSERMLATMTPCAPRLQGVEDVFPRSPEPGIDGAGARR